MRTRNLLSLWLGIIFLYAFILACGGQLSQLPASPEKTYGQALSIYNNANEAYVAALMLQDPETKAQWKKDINPQLDKADIALNAWWTAIGTDREDDAQLKYLKLWGDLFPLLFQLGIVEVEE